MREIPSGDYEYCIIGESLFNQYLSAVLTLCGHKVIVLDNNNVGNTVFNTFHLVDLIEYINDEKDEHYFYDFECTNNRIPQVDCSSDAILEAASTLINTPKSATYRNIIQFSKKFLIDLFPIVIGTNGITVEAIINFDISYHISVFSPANLKVYMENLGKFCIVPLNKSQVFVSECLSFEEKYFFTKFIQNCFSLLDKIDEVEDGDLDTFFHQNHINDHLKSFLNFSILVNWNCVSDRKDKKVQFLFKLKESFEAIKKFHTNSKYLMSINGCQDLSHCFLRKASVMGATTCYGIPIKSISPNGEKCDVIFDDKHVVSAKYVVLDHGYAPYLAPEGPIYREKLFENHVVFNHCILITTNIQTPRHYNGEDSLVFDFMVIPKDEDEKNHVWIIKFGSGNLCPIGCNLIHFTCLGNRNDSKENLRQAVNKYLDCNPVKALWECHYASKHSQPENSFVKMPYEKSNIYLTNSLICSALSDDIVEQVYRFLPLIGENIENLPKPNNASNGF